MERFRHLLYVERGPGGSVRGFSLAVDVAASHAARLTVAGAVSSSDIADGASFPEAAAAQREEACVRRWRERLEGLADVAMARGVEAHVRVLHGRPAAAVVREVALGGHDLVLKPAEPGDAPWPRYLHPTDRELLRDVPCAVWLLNPAQGPCLGVVLAAVDVTEGRPEEVNRRIVRVAASLADRAGARMHVVHALCTPGTSILASPTRGLARRPVEEILAAARRERRERVERLLAAEVPGRPFAVKVVRGSPLRVVREMARRTGADVVVVGRSGRRGLEGLLLGNFAERIVGRVPSSVLAVEVGGRAPGGDPGPGPGADERRNDRVGSTRETGR